MADFSTYSDIEQKRNFFSNGNKESFVIKTKNELDKWFKDVEEQEKEQTDADSTALIYRGMIEAKHKLLTSSQRIWIGDEMQQWANKSYLEFINDLVKQAKQNKLIKKVFDLYSYTGAEREFPILSLLQHYGAPTPLMDWTYNSNVAFYFATDNLQKTEPPKADIDNYFSVYRINKRKYEGEFRNIIDFTPKGLIPEILSFKDFGDDKENAKSNGIFYLSDFERRGESTGDAKHFERLKIRRTKPLTSIYNQNIIPQEGLFIFNPFSKKTLEDIFNTDLNKSGWTLTLTPFDCFNIHKDLAEYLRRKIDVQYKINKAFIYPNLNDEARKIKEAAINGLIGAYKQ